VSGCGNGGYMLTEKWSDGVDVGRGLKGME
jgi:hypothetical protein